MATQADLARGWMRKGDSDRLNAQRTVNSPGASSISPCCQIALRLVA